MKTPEKTTAAVFPRYLGGEVHFAQIFRQTVGVAPTQFRNAL